MRKYSIKKFNDLEEMGCFVTNRQENIKVEDIIHKNNEYFLIYSTEENDNIDIKKDNTVDSNCIKKCDKECIKEFPIKNSPHTILLDTEDCKKIAYSVAKAIGESGYISNAGLNEWFIAARAYRGYLPDCISQFVYYFITKELQNYVNKFIKKITVGVNDTVTGNISEDGSGLDN